MLTKALAAVLVAAGLASSGLTANASAPPVGPLPKGPTTTITVQHGLVFALALSKPPSGQYWRAATSINIKVAKPLSDGELEGNIILLYKAVAPGTTSVAYGLTRDETPKALKSHTFKITVR